MKEATLQVRMESELKKEAEELYRNLGTSFAEAVRIFARQSVMIGGMPFPVSLTRETAPSMYGAAHKYANPAKRVLEDEGAWRKAAVKKVSGAVCVD